MLWSLTEKEVEYRRPRKQEECVVSMENAWEPQGLGMSSPSSDFSTSEVLREEESLGSGHE